MSDKTRRRPLIAITIGDPYGIGPEIVVKSLLDEETRSGSDFKLVGSAKVFDEARRRFAPGVRFGDESKSGGGSVSLRNVEAGAIEESRPDSSPGPQAESGKHAVNAVKEAVRMAMSGEADAVVTAPASKEGMNLAGYGYAGHTELLAELTGARRPVMFFAAKELRVALVTTHVALRDVPRLITCEKVTGTAETLNEALETYFGLSRPRIGICALNPHAGESGLFGDEEKDISAAVEALKGKGIAASGPYPADTIMLKNLSGELDAVVALYHDQAMIAVKMYGMDWGVNVTLGLPVIRTSPDHGTAYDIAWRGVAREASMREAIKLAVAMARTRGERQ